MDTKRHICSFIKQMYDKLKKQEEQDLEMMMKINSLWIHQTFTLVFR